MTELFFLRLQTRFLGLFFNKVGDSFTSIKIAFSGVAHAMTHARTGQMQGPAGRARRQLLLLS